MLIAIRRRLYDWLRDVIPDMLDSIVISYATRPYNDTGRSADACDLLRRQQRASTARRGRLRTMRVYARSLACAATPKTTAVQTPSNVASAGTTRSS